MAEISDEMLKALRPLMEQAGIDMDVQGEEDAPGKPKAITVNIGQQLRLLGQELGSILGARGLYRFRDGFVTVDESDPKNSMPEMTPESFISWVQGHVETERFNAKEKEMKLCDMTRQLAINVMASDTFRTQVPRIKAVVPSRMPVWGEDGKPVLLKKGYNRAEEIFVLKSAPVLDEEMEVGAAFERYHEIFGQFPWGDEGRSKAAHVACCMGIFCQYLFDDAEVVPMFQFTANIEGAGKSTVARSAVIPVYTLDGYGSTDYSDDGKFKDELNSIAKSGKGYLFLDDVAGSLFNPVLNRWVTDPTWEFRKFHSQTQIRVDKRCMTILTDNGCTLSDDLIRRSVIIYFEMDERAAEREAKIKQPIDHRWLNRPENRAELLSIWWTFIREWAEQGMPKAPRTIPSFAQWTNIIGGIVQIAGFGDAFAPANLLDAGDKRRTEVDRLLELIVEQYEIKDVAVDVTLPDLCELARSNGLFEYPLGEMHLVRVEMDSNPVKYYDYAEIGELTEAARNAQAARFMNPQKQASPFSKRLKKQLGRRFQVNGKFYRFTKLDARTSTYQVTPADYKENKE